MDATYRSFDPRVAGLKALIKRLREIYGWLLLKTSGDVDEALRWLERIALRHGFFGERFGLQEFRELLAREGQVRRAVGGGLELTARAEQGMRASALGAIFANLRRDVGGDHRVAAAGQGAERLPETRPWVFGDAMDALAVNETLHNAVRRSGLGPIHLSEEDLAVHETEHNSSCATVLLIDVSHSMILYGEDRITPAKEVALALTELIRTRYPKDALDVVLFGDEAWQVPIEQLPYVGVGPFHTNTRGGLLLAREILRKKRQCNRQIFMITDGKPSALTERNGDIYKNPFGLDRRVIEKTLEEGSTCRRLGIPVTTFMLTDDPTLVEFVETFTRTNRGRAYYSGADRLGSFLFVDYIRNRRRQETR